ncbi:MAG: enoyl-CoA hydratase/isomerase family protein, partial [Bacteroidia bacterium]
EGFVKTEMNDGVATITFFHPRSNSLPSAILRGLAHAIDAAGSDEQAKVIVLRSDGDKSFCAGASFDELVAVSSFDEGRNFFSGFALVINAIRKAPKFVIARVQGKAVGGGVGIACAADYTLAHDSADVKLSELAVGIGPFVVGPAVERKVGKSAFATMAINATEWRSAYWAKQVGMYSDTFETVENLDAAVSKLADTLATSSPEAMKHIKEVLWEGTGDWESLLMARAEISGTLVLSQFTRDAIAKFKAGAR